MNTLSADQLVGRWALKRAVVYGKGAKHLEECGIDESSVGSVDFGAGFGGGCSTCAYAFEEMRFSVSCRCGKVRKDLDVELDSMSMSTILQEISALEQVVEAEAEAARKVLEEGFEAAREATQEASYQIMEDRDRYYDSLYGESADED